MRTLVSVGYDKNELYFKWEFLILEFLDPTMTSMFVNGSPIEEFKYTKFNLW
jgi:hypothetical protein